MIRIKNKRTQKIYDVTQDTIDRLVARGELKKYLLLPAEDIVVVDIKRKDDEEPKQEYKAEESGLSWEFIPKPKIDLSAPLPEPQKIEIITEPTKPKRKKKTNVATK